VTKKLGHGEDVTQQCLPSDLHVFAGHTKDLRRAFPGSNLWGARGLARDHDLIDQSRNTGGCIFIGHVGPFSALPPYPTGNPRLIDREKLRCQTQLEHDRCPLGNSGGTACRGKHAGEPFFFLWGAESRACCREIGWPGGHDR